MARNGKGRGGGPGGRRGGSGAGEGHRTRRRAGAQRPRDRRVALTLSDEEFEELAQAADEDDRPIANFARRLLFKALRERR